MYNEMSFWLFFWLLYIYIVIVFSSIYILHELNKIKNILENKGWNKMFDKFDIVCKKCGSKNVDLDMYSDCDNMGKYINR